MGSIPITRSTSGSTGREPGSRSTSQEGTSVGSLIKKRRKKMNKHKHRKLLKKRRHQKRK